jgi:class 3 adenylate cyclase
VLNSKEILERTGISRATLNNYIGWGIVPKPDVLPPEPSDGDAPRIGYFPDEIVERIAQIQRLKKDGWSMARIAAHFGGSQAPAAIPEPVAVPTVAALVPAAPQASDSTAAPSALPLAQPAPDQQASGPGATQPKAVDAANRRRPVLTSVAVLAAGLQHSSTIWSELPPEEYFELINHVWSTADPIFRRHAGTHGKHPADGMVSYFFPLPAGSYLWNTLLAALELKEAMRRVSKEWQLRKGWSTELYMNIGIDEGQEWLGTFKSATDVEFTSLAETLKQAARISDFARFGAIWVTKNLLGKLSAQERERLTYGVRRKSADGRHVFVGSVFSNVRRVASHDAPRADHPKEVALLPITEIVQVSAPAGPSGASWLPPKFN